MRIKCVQSKKPHKCPSLFPFAIYHNQVSEFYIFFVYRYIYNHLALQIMLKQLILKSPPICLGWVCKKTVYIYVCIYWLSLYSCHHRDYHEKSSENIIRCWKTLTWMNAKLYIQKGGAMCFWVLKTSTKNPTCYCPVSRNKCIQNWTINVSVN